jgi:hypothetical protein
MGSRGFGCEGERVYTSLLIQAGVFYPLAVRKILTLTLTLLKNSKL